MSRSLDFDEMQGAMQKIRSSQKSKYKLLKPTEAPTLPVISSAYRSVKLKEKNE